MFIASLMFGAPPVFSRLLPSGLMSRAPIDQPVSQESSESHNLVGDRAEHPVCDH